jgi:hypothetical protein
MNLLNGGRLDNTGARGKELRPRTDRLRFLSSHRQGAHSAFPYAIQTDLRCRNERSS